MKSLGMNHLRRNVINYAKLPKYLIEFYLIYLIQLSDCISIHPMGKYSLHQGISHISTIQPQNPWTIPPIPNNQILHPHHRNGKKIGIEL